MWRLRNGGCHNERPPRPFLHGAVPARSLRNPAPRVCYTIRMSTPKNTSLLAAALALALAAGCATWTFTPTRSSKFVNEENGYLLVDYGQEEHESTFIGPGGVRLPFRSNLKVRVELPDGTRFVAFQNMSTEGRLYVSDNERWKFLEKGVAAYVAERSKDGNGYL